MSDAQIPTPSGYPEWWGPGGKPTVDETVDLARTYYALDGNGTGGAFHIVLDDGNTDDHSVIWCDGYSAGRGDGLEGRFLGAALERLTEAERDEVYKRYEEYMT